MEETRNERLDDGKDHRTMDLIGMLRMRGYQAGHDEKVGGHSDIVVRHKKGYLWLGESKIHADYDYLLKGFQQLCTRYAPGGPNTSEGGLLIFVKGKDCAGVVEEWRKRLKDHGLVDFADVDCIDRAGLAFFSTHKHTESGLSMRVRHLGVIQGWNPQDRRGGKKTT
ncbi:hypothetical protein D9M72_370890 [compost metagenome]